jgi:hypothetical protein
MIKGDIKGCVRENRRRDMGGDVRGAVKGT